MNAIKGTRPLEVIVDVYRYGSTVKDTRLIQSTQITDSVWIEPDGTVVNDPAVTVPEPGVMRFLRDVEKAGMHIIVARTLIDGVSAPTTPYKFMVDDSFLP